MHRRGLLGLVIFGLLVLVAVALVPGGGFSHRLAAWAASATPAAAGLPGVGSAVLARGEPVGLVDAELALGRVTIAPGASIPSHEHPGTQVAAIIDGELNYTVLAGTVLVRRASNGDGASAPEMVGAGQTVVLRAGDSVVEQPGAVHMAHNAGAEPVDIFLSTLFPTGEPRTIFVDAATAGATPGRTAQQERAGEDATGFVGAWLVAPTIAGSTATALTTFNADGTVFTSNRPIQPAPESLPVELVVQSLGHGSWVATGPRTADLTFVILQTDVAGVPLGTRVIRGSLELDAAGDRWTGTFSATLVDPSGAEISSMAGSVEATRITVEPMAATATPATASPAAD